MSGLTEKRDSAENGDDIPWPTRRRRLYSWLDSDAGNERNEPHFELWWRPAEEGDNTFSDWRITIENESTCRSYSVHKDLLASKSKYFQRLFEGHFAENDKKCSVFTEFSYTIVENFDLFLDCVYIRGFFPTKNDHPVDLTAAQICTLIFLFDYFQMSYLLLRCKAHMIQTVDDLGMGAEKTLNAYLGKLVHCQADCNVPFIWDIIIPFFGREAGSFWRTYFAPTIGYNAICGNMNECLTAMGPEGLSAILRQCISRNCTLEYLPILVASASNPNFGVMSVSNFVRLTSPELLPKMENRGAMYLLHLIPKYKREATGDSIRLINELKERCLHVVYQWLIYKRALYICFNQEFQETMTMADIQVDSLIQLAQKDSPRGTMEQSTKRIHECKWTALKDALLAVKLANPASAPLKVNHPTDCFVWGTYCRDGDHYHNRHECVWSDIIIQKADNDNSWKICRLKYSGSTYYTSSAPSPYPGCPPFSGWKDMEEKDVELTLEL